MLNGAECEPYITCDDMLMREHAGEVIEGGRILRHALQAQRVLLGIEDNKPDALPRCARRPADMTGSNCCRRADRYPAGGERQLIQVLTGREVPSSGLPADLGVLCHNVGTAAAA